MVCHLTSVHKASDNRIFFKECRSLAPFFDITLIGPAQRSEIIDGVQIIAIRPPKNRLYRFLITDWVLFFKGLRVNAPLYHIHDPELIIPALLLRLLGKKIIFDIEEDFRADLSEKKWLPLKGLFHIIFRFFDDLAVRFFYIILAEKSYEDIYKKRTSDCITIQNFVPVDVLKSGDDIQSSPKTNTLALVGTLSARRALPYILDALYILKKREIIVYLRCIGTKDKPVTDILDSSAAWPHISEQVDFKGYVPFPASILDCRDCIAGLALPETLPNHIRSYPTKMFEYMAIGLPVIASDFPLYKDVVEKNACGLNVTPENSTAIADAISYICKNPEAAYNMGKNGIDAVKDYDWKTEAEKLVGFYKKILQIV